MSQISDYIEDLYNSISEDIVLPISEDSVQDAIGRVNNFDIKDMKSLFVILSALNLLNATIRIDDLKSALYFNYVKSNVSKVADFVISNHDKFEEASVYYDKSDKCIYFDIFRVVFSFHQIKETKLIIEMAANADPIVWPGIRLQHIAQAVFEYAQTLIVNEKKLDAMNNSQKGVKTGKANTSLITCPDCGKFVSKTAKFCPNCGFDFNNDNEIAKDIAVGNRVQIEVNGVLTTGVVLQKSKSFLGLRLRNESIYRVKYDAISSIVLRTDEEEDTISSISISDMLNEILTLEGLNENSSIKTNSTVQERSKNEIKIITDFGKTTNCRVAIGLKDTTKPGDRLFFGGWKSKGVYGYYVSFVEMTYKEIRQRFITALNNIDKDKKHSPRVVCSIIEYFKLTITNSESTAILHRIEDSVLKRLRAHSLDEDTSRLEIKDKAVLKVQSGSAKIAPEATMSNVANEPALKLEIVEKAKTNKILADKLPKMPEDECRQVEKELDSMIREGKREECLKNSYEVITTKRPTPKYLKSYLDRIVNTEIALNHSEEAMEALAVLIAYSENDNKPNNLSHLYISLARLFIKQGKSEEAMLALDWAEYIFPQNEKVVSNLRLSISMASNQSSVVSSEVSSQDSQFANRDVVVSRMLMQDVEQFLKARDSMDDEEETSPLELYNMAEVASYDKTKSFEFRAQMFLDAASAYLNANKASETEFKKAVAHYARMKGNSLLAKIAESVQQYPDSRSHLIAECDSARSYYLEALGMYNDLAQKQYVHDLLLKYLKIESLVSQVEGGRTPDAEWNKVSLKEKMKECLNDDNVEGQKVLYRACIAIGSSSERLWSSLANDNDGTGPFYAKLYYSSFRVKAYGIINTMEKSNIDTSLTPGDFLRKVFENRQNRIRELKSHIEDCLTWKFDPFSVSSFEQKLITLEGYKELMTATDRLALDSITEVITILKPYAGRKGNERYRNLVSSQQILIKSQRVVAETTTYYGRIFFFHLQENWLKSISLRIEEMDASTLPKLQVLPDPCYIKKDKEGRGIIDFVVTNYGDSTAQSFVVHVRINGKDYEVFHDSELSAGDTCGQSIVSDDFVDLESALVVFQLTTRYQGRDLETVETEATYEIESGDYLTDESQIPWILDATPEENIFKGREKDLSTLINHYLSPERSFTYILYGLTRTGKSSILDYFRKRIDSKSLYEDSVKKIVTFKWDFSKLPYTIPKDVDENEIREKKQNKQDDFWTNLLEVNVYDKLDDSLKDVVDASFSDNCFPEKPSQADLITIVNALNTKNLIPLITIDEFSFIRELLKNHIVDATFVSVLRSLALEGKACFVYAGTYSIKNLPEEKEFGLEGQLTNTRSMHINEIEQIYADELIDACDSIVFDGKAKEYIRALSGRVPYWIQWICLNCGKYAVANKKRYFGYNEVDRVVRMLTGEDLPSRNETLSVIDKTNFQNNQITPDDRAEQQLISSIAEIIKGESTHIERGVSLDELNKLWDQFEVPSEKRLNMTKALRGLVEKKVIHQFTDETREVYRLNVDLFRRWWYVHHKDIKLELSY